MTSSGTFENVELERFFDVRVAGKRAVARDTYHFELVAMDGGKLPGFSPGSHITVVTPIGSRRNYSLCSDAADTMRYEIAVKRDINGRGGSISITDDVNEGGVLTISAPRNNFELSPRAKQSIFIAGGIGITPILSMMRGLKRGANGHSFELFYCTRDAECTAFADELQAEFPGLVTVHHDKGDSANGFDFWPVFERPTAAHVYCCGPKGLMDSVADMSGHWPSGSIHFESFGVDAKLFSENTAFSVTLQRSGKRVFVRPEQTLLEVLRAAGYVVRSSCESGTCGSCKTGLVSGAVEHRDSVLSDDEKRDHIMVCVSRAAAGELVLDL
ncbi:MAG: PDR/VanB family oxidoreductase [Casimicrobium sp.]